MDNLDNDENDQNLDNHAVDLKGCGLDLQSLRDGKATEFEIDPSSVDSNAELERYFDKEELFKQLNYECLDGGSGTDTDDDVEKTPFEKMMRRMESVTNDSGVMKKILHEGAGSIVPPSATCTVHYNAWLDMSDEPFDSSRLRGKKHIIKIGSGEGIPGFEIAVATMKRGELSRFIFKCEYTWGPMGCPPRIPPKALVMFEIELISFMDQTDLDTVNKMSEEERSQAGFDKILAAVEALKIEGTEAYQVSNIPKASGIYSRALRMLENARLADEEDEEKMKLSAHKLYLNLCLCDVKLKKPGRAIKYAKKVLEREPGNIKAYYRQGKAHQQLQEFSQAKSCFMRALKLDPNNRETREALNELDNDMHIDKEKNIKLSKKMLNIKEENPKFTLPSDNKPVENESQMVKLITNRLKSFKESTESDEMTLPSNLTGDEISGVKKAAQQLGLKIVIHNFDSESTIKVSKS